MALTSVLPFQSNQCSSFRLDKTIVAHSFLKLFNPYLLTFSITQMEELEQGFHFSFFFSLLCILIVQYIFTLFTFCIDNNTIFIQKQEHFFFKFSWDSFLQLHDPSVQEHQLSVMKVVIMLLFPTGLITFLFSPLILLF